MTTFWIDVSHHDWNRRGGNLDWAKVHAKTSPVMCARATYGDPAGWNRASHHFGDFQRGAAAAGFDVRGGYHNLIRGDAASMRRQVDWLRREMDAYDCHWAMADIERYAELVAANMWPRWQDVLRWRDAWTAADDRVMAWYLPQWVYGSSGFAGGALGELPGLFIQSHYAGGDGTITQIYANAGGDTGTGWDDRVGNRYPDAWQFTAVANVDGASDQTDVNAFRGTPEQLRAALISGDDMSFTKEEKELLFHLLQNGSDAAWKGGTEMGRAIADPPAGTFGNATSQKLDAVWGLVEKAVAILEAGPLSPEQVAALEAAAERGAQAGVDEQEIAAAVLRTLTPEAIAEALDGEVAQELLDRLTAKLAS